MIDVNDLNKLDCDRAFKIYMNSSFTTVEDEEDMYEFIKQVNELQRKYTKPIAALLKGSNG